MRHFSRVLLLSLPAGAFLLAALSCASTAERAAVVDNTFPSTIQNESDFAVVIDGVSLAPKASTSHRFPLHEGALYDGWSVEYSIPLTSAVQCTVREKLAVADGQATVRIENPRAESMDGCYVIVQNEHARALQCTDGDKSKIYPCYTSGVLGGRGTPSAYTVAARASAVCVLESAAMRLYLAADERNALPVAAPCTYRRGYVYTVRYDENGVRLRDARPLQCAQEALWAKSYPASTVLRDVLQRDGRIFALATETLQDAKGNAYISSFVQCLTLRGEALWKQEYGEKGADTYLYAMTLVDGNILVAGQRIAGGMSGILLLYAPSGTLLKAASVTEAVGLDALTVLADGRVLAGGYDAHGQAVMFSVPPSLAATPQKTPAGYRALQAAVQSLSCMVAGADGALYAAGETPQQERPTARVARLNADGTVSVLYTAREPYSFIAAMHFDAAAGALVVAGTVNAADAYGNGGTPFLRCIDAASGAVLWERFSAQHGYEVAARIAPCDTYGFVQLLVNADADGEVCAPCALVRTDATGGEE